MMKIKNLLIVLFVIVLNSGCSSIQTIKDSNMSMDKNFLTDILASLQTNKQEETSPKIEKKNDTVLQSTHLLLNKDSKLAQPDDLQQQADNYVMSKATQKVNSDDVWYSLTTMYQFPNINNRKINTQKKWFIKHKSTIEKISERAEPYLYFISEEVKKRNMPGEIALLPIIESSFRTHAYSSMKASGLWQFIPATGRYFNLKQNWWYDGRRDVYKSTLAALTYLEQLNKYYKGDWFLTLAAYNAGVGNVNKAIRKNLKKGLPIDYWSLALPKETRQYVPKLIAVSRVIADHKKYNISLMPIKNKPYLALVNTQSQIELAVAAQIANMTLEEMRAYNPGFKRWITDPDGPHHLLIPLDKATHFKRQLASLDRVKRVSSYQHKIRSGESLGLIAQKYGVSISVLKQANQLKNNRIRTGKYLFVPVEANNSTKGFAKISKKRSKSTSYKVRKGDSFWLIARRYNVSHKKLAALNNFSTGDKLVIGKKIKIPSSTLSVKNKKRSKNKTIVYKVKAGDSLYTISKQFKVTINELKRWNHLNSKKYLQPGQHIKLFIASS